MTAFPRAGDRSEKNRQATGESVLVAAGLFGFVLLFMVGTLTLDGSARAVPALVLVPLALLSGHALWSELWSLIRGRTTVTPVRHLDLGVLGWIILLPVLVEAAGLPAGGSVFVTLWLWRRGGERLPVAISAGLATALGLWLLTATILQGIPLAGRLTSWFV